MSEGKYLPYIPESAPFTQEQRAYLNGFFAGLFSRAPTADEAPGNGAPAEKVAQPLTILFGSQTGNAEGLARRTAKEAAKRGFSPTVLEMLGFEQPKDMTGHNLRVPKG